ncbi:ribonuclease P protein component [Salinimicrobium oceani]|uniref:Ribonuclease P protein component n=1 Tax=Salinimicrobium oceani TaxID=2722702 RepID=A0ABX1D3K6_9FLAO|nr:ribonuclease P protein component [Salinimicrobium oceani]NJW53799.1 ribonuclease P protein component [Salinimicrobium oceani]
MDQSFGKKEKLKSKLLIDQLFSEGTSVKKYPLRLVYLPKGKATDEKNRIAVSVPKRSFKKAVDRMKLKRLMREAYRKNKYLVTNKLAASYAIMIIYTGREMMDYSTIFQATEELLKKFVQQEKGKDNEKDIL